MLVLVIILSVGIGCVRQSEPASTPSTNSWAFDFIQWQDASYRLTNEVVERMGEPIGYVDNYSTDELASTGGIFSNHFPKGTPIYAINGESTEDAITVQQDGEWVRLFNTDKFGWQLPAK
ncbi:hypothetical protein [Paenibacillus guangzhouensis]|uniref:hypothetical protein n=1 Tax=Paenibacillus guangzhouensis TaxID=1473112 RepID=UPI0012673DC6|nr:hypothetical protein [Paenibacillus guangzhouensis]